MKSEADVVMDVLSGVFHEGDHVLTNDWGYGDGEHMVAGTLARMLAKKHWIVDIDGQNYNVHRYECELEHL